MNPLYGLVFVQPNVPRQNPFARHACVAEIVATWEQTDPPLAGRKRQQYPRRRLLHFGFEQIGSQCLLNGRSRRSIFRSKRHRHTHAARAAVHNVDDSLW